MPPMVLPNTADSLAKGQNLSLIQSLDVSTYLKEIWGTEKHAEMHPKSMQSAKSGLWETVQVKRIVGQTG